MLKFKCERRPVDKATPLSNPKPCKCDTRCRVALPSSIGNAGGTRYRPLQLARYNSLGGAYRTRRTRLGHPLFYRLLLVLSARGGGRGGHVLRRLLPFPALSGFTPLGAGVRPLHPHPPLYCPYSPPPSTQTVSQCPGAYSLIGAACLCCLSLLGPKVSLVILLRPSRLGPTHTQGLDDTNAPRRSAHTVPQKHSLILPCPTGTILPRGIYHKH